MNKAAGTALIALLAFDCSALGVGVLEESRVVETFDKGNNRSVAIERRKRFGTVDAKRYEYV